MTIFSWSNSLILGMGCRERAIAKRRIQRSRDHDLLFEFRRHAPREMKQLLDRRDLRFEVLPACRIVDLLDESARLPGRIIEQQDRTIDVFLAGLLLASRRRRRRASLEIRHWRMQLQAAPRMQRGLQDNYLCHRWPVDLNIAFSSERPTARLG